MSLELDAILAFGSLGLTLLVALAIRIRTVMRSMVRKPRPTARNAQVTAGRLPESSSHGVSAWFSSASSDFKSSQASPSAPCTRSATRPAGSRAIACITAP